MNTPEPNKILLRDCNAVKVPEGITGVLKKGNEVRITQALGGSLTVEYHGNLYKIRSEDCDAILGDHDIPTSPSDKQDEEKETAVDDVWEVLRTCYDPEIPINIVELGLIYRCEMYKKADKINIEIDMTLTAPGCGMGPFIVDEVQTKISALPNIDVVSVDLVFDPPWNQEMMSDEARLQVGLY